MALEVPPEESNRCVRGCCRSAAIPLHLPAASFSLLSPIARGKLTLPAPCSLLLFPDVLASEECRVVMGGGEMR
jgi:hypothetical protein